MLKVIGILLVINICFPTQIWTNAHLGHITVTQTLSAVTQLVLLHATVFKDIQETVWNVLVRLLAHEHLIYLFEVTRASFI